MSVRHEHLTQVCNWQEVAKLYTLVQNDINPQKIITQTLGDIPALSRSMLLAWSDRILTS